MSQPVNLWCSVRFGQLEVNFSSDDVSQYAPDVAHDITTHVVRAFSEAISELRAHGVIGSIDDDLAEQAQADDDEDDEDDEDA